jgi:hypothetical protein
MTSVRRSLEDSRNQQALGWAIFDRVDQRTGDEVSGLIGLAIDRDTLE